MNYSLIITFKTKKQHQRQCLLNRLCVVLTIKSKLLKYKPHLINQRQTTNMINTKNAEIINAKQTPRRCCCCFEMYFQCFLSPFPKL